MLCNTVGGMHGDSPYFCRHREHFLGERLPFGTGAFHYANEAKHKYQHKFGSRLACGVFVGYVPDFGLTWFGLCFLIVIC